MFPVKPVELYPSKTARCPVCVLLTSFTFTVCGNAPNRHPLQTRLPIYKSSSTLTPIPTLRDPTPSYILSQILKKENFRIYKLPKSRALAQTPDTMYTSVYGMLACLLACRHTHTNTHKHTHCSVCFIYLYTCTFCICMPVHMRVWYLSHMPWLMRTCRNSPKPFCSHTHSQYGCR